MIVAACLAGFALVGFSAWVELAGDVEDAVFALVGGVGVLGVLLALVNAAKAKFGLAFLGLLVPPVGAVGAAWLAKPSSPWAHLLYRGAKLERARARYPGRDA